MEDHLRSCPLAPFGNVMFRYLHWNFSMSLFPCLCCRCAPAKLHPKKKQKKNYVKRRQQQRSSTEGLMGPCIW